MTTIVCECCWLIPVHVSLSNSSRVCTDCESHKFTISTLRADHKRLVDGVKASHAKEVAHERDLLGRDEEELKSLRAEVETMVAAAGKDLAELPEQLLGRVHSTALAELHARVRDTYFTRNRAMNVVWTIDERHHALTGEKCSCGEVLHRCSEYRAIGFFREDYERWERKQIELMKAGKEHGLPRNHPEARKLNQQSYLWRGLRSTETEVERHRAG